MIKFFLGLCSIPISVVPIVNTVSYSSIKNVSEEKPFSRDLSGMMGIFDELKSNGLLKNNTKLQVIKTWNEGDKKSLLSVIDEINAQIRSRGIGSWIKENWFQNTSVALNVARLLYDVLH